MEEIFEIKEQKWRWFVGVTIGVLFLSVGEDRLWKIVLGGTAVAFLFLFRKGSLVKPKIVKVKISTTGSGIRIETGDCHVLDSIENEIERVFIEKNLVTIFYRNDAGTPSSFSISKDRLVDEGDWERLSSIVELASVAG